MAELSVGYGGSRPPEKIKVGFSPSPLFKEKINKNIKIKN
jgi:hypothetical protein